MLSTSKLAELLSIDSEIVREIEAEEARVSSLNKTEILENAVLESEALSKKFRALKDEVDAKVSLKKLNPEIRKIESEAIKNKKVVKN